MNLLYDFGDKEFYANFWNIEDLKKEEIDFDSNK